MAKPTLLFILKAPIVGLVKTRLAKEIGKRRACAAYKAMVEHLLDSLASYAPFEIHYAPSGVEAPIQSWLGLKYLYFPQSEGDLGKRMEIAVAGAFQRGATSVILLGGDCPYVNSEVIEKVVQGLVENDIVIGPAEDGGYYLLALNQPKSSIFREISWGTESVFPTTLERIEKVGLTVKILHPLEDVDDLLSWRRAETYLWQRLL